MTREERINNLAHDLTMKYIELINNGPHFFDLWYNKDSKDVRLDVKTYWRPYFWEHYKSKGWYWFKRIYINKRWNQLAAKKWFVETLTKLPI